MTDDEDVANAKSDIEEARSPPPPPDNPLKSPEIGIETKKLEKLRKVEAEKVIVLSFRSLQLQRIGDLQDELLRLTAKHRKVAERQAGLDDEIDRALGNYADALRNYETLSLNAQPTIPTGARLVGKLGLEFDIGAEPRRGGLLGFVKNHLPSVFWDIMSISIGIFQLAGPPGPTMMIWKAIGSMVEGYNTTAPSDILTFLELTAGNLGFRELDQRGREARSRHRAFTQRMVMAIFGGAALIGPMLIMTLHPSRNTSLITVSVATFIFALVLAVIANDSAGKDVLGATAAYAAVLVVFVGTSTSPTA